MSTLERASLVEATVLQAFVKLGLPVLKPFQEGLPYDLLIDLGDRAFLRVQCKSARLKPGVIEFNSRGTDHGKGRLPYAGLADVFGVVGPNSDQVYVLPVEDCLGFVVRLRMEPTKNNQRIGVRHAVDFELETWSLEDLRGTVIEGRAAQLRMVS